MFSSLKIYFSTMVNFRSDLLIYATETVRTKHLLIYRTLTISFLNGGYSCVFGLFNTYPYLKYIL